MMNLLIAGSRGYTNYPEFKLRVDKRLKGLDLSKVLIIEGGARGVDRLARQYAIEQGIQYKTFEAEWDKYGKKAGMLRNEKMAELATHAMLFWDGESPGTRNMRDICEQYEIPFVEIRVKIHDRKNKEEDYSAYRF